MTSRLVRAAVAAAALGTLTSCGGMAAIYQPHHKAASVAASSAPGDTATSLPTAEPTDEPTTDAATTPVDALGTRVLPVPASATEWVETPTGKMDLTAFVDNFYKADARKDELVALKRRGFAEAWRRAWTADDETQVDVFLIRFADATGARSQALSLQGTWAGETGAGTSTFHDVATGGTGLVDKSLDSLGDALVKETAAYRDTVAYVRFYSPARPDRSAEEQLFARQFALLKR